MGTKNLSENESSNLQGFGESGGACGLIFECDLSPLDCGLKVECDLGSSSSGSTTTTQSNPNVNNSKNKENTATELQGLGANGNCGLIYLCDLNPLDCGDALKLECDLGDGNPDSETQKAIEKATAQYQLQGLGSGGGASFVLECDLKHFSCGLKLKWDLGSD